MSSNSIGALVGFFIGLLIASVLIIFSNKNRKFKTEYDERQKVIRGNAYKYGFMFLVCYLLLIMFFDATGFEIPLDLAALAVTGIVSGVTVVACYSIWNGAYWGLNNNVKRYMIVFIAGFVLNGVIAVISLVMGTMFKDGIVHGSFVNLIVTIMFVIISIVMFIRKRIDLPNHEED